MKKLLSSFLIAGAMLFADGPGIAESKYLQKDFAISADPTAAAWKGVMPIVADKGPVGEMATGHRTEIRSRWTSTYLYLLFTCPYNELYLLPNPKTDGETNKLWERDVAEVFLGTDMEKIWRYREFQVSPQGEYVDLDIDRKTPLPEGGWKWNSGFQVAARIDAKNKIWYGAFKIPLSSLVEPGMTAPVSGQELRVNFYRLQGPNRAGIKPPRVMVAWQATGAPNYHIPEAFGRLRLVGGPKATPQH